MVALGARVHRRLMCMVAFLTGHLAQVRVMRIGALTSGPDCQLFRIAMAVQTDGRMHCLTWWSFLVADRAVEPSILMPVRQIFFWLRPGIVGQAHRAEGEGQQKNIQHKAIPLQDNKVKHHKTFLSFESGKGRIFSIPSLPNKLFPRFERCCVLTGYAPEDDAFRQIAATLVNKFQS